jgi:predicted nucleic acid-binding Zn ribbon protein
LRHGDIGPYDGFVRLSCKEILRFLRQEKKWWLIPLLVSILILVALVYFTQGPAPLSPFMYSVK